MPPSSSTGTRFFTAETTSGSASIVPGTYAGTLGRDLGAWQYGGFTYAMNLSDGDSTSCPVFGSSSDEGEVTVPVNSVTVNGQGGGTQNAP